MKQLFNISLVILSIFGSSAHSEEIDVKQVFVESLAEGVKEGVCGDQDSIHWMMRSTDENIRKQGYACFTASQVKKINGRLNGTEANSDDDSKQKATKSNHETGRLKEERGKVNPDTQCRNEKGKIKCKIWFPETEINGETIPAGYRDVDM